MTELRLTTLAGIAGFCIAALAGCDQMGMPSVIGETAYVIGSPSRPFYPNGMDGKFHEMNVV